MYEYKVGERVWGYIKELEMSGLSWRKGNILSRFTNSFGEKKYNISCIHGGFEISENNIISDDRVEDLNI